MCRAFFFVGYEQKLCLRIPKLNMIAVPSLPLRAGFDIIHTL